MKIKSLIIFLFLIEAALIVNSCSNEGSSNDENLVVQNSTPAEVSPPSAANLLYPEKDEICQTGISVSDRQAKVNFQWNASNNTDSYDLKITNLKNDQLTNINSISETSNEVTLDKGTPYSWQIVSKRSGTSETATSSSWKFYLSGEGLSNYPPYPAELISPTSGKSFAPSTNSVELSWEGSHPEGELITYTLFFDNLDGLQEPLTDNKNITSKSKIVDVDSGNT